MKPSLTPIAIGATHTEIIVNMRGSSPPQIAIGAIGAIGITIEK
jgi:hypothetical protein